MAVTVGVLLALVFIFGVAAATYFLFRRHQIVGLKLSGIDRPVFSRNPNSDTLQIVANEVTCETSVDPATQAATWKQDEPLGEAPPSLREELRLGAQGAGFKRFK